MGEREGVIVDIYINLQYSIVLLTIIYNNMITIIIQVYFLYKFTIKFNINVCNLMSCLLYTSRCV